jgi:methyl-accepting chemotaxis protein
MEVAMRRLAGGDLTTDIPALDRGDEVGRMAQAMLVFRQNAEQASKLQGEAERVRQAGIAGKPPWIRIGMISACRSPV